MATVDQIVKRLAAEDESYEQFHTEHYQKEPDLRTVGFSPKMVVATVISILLGGTVAGLNAVQENPDLLGGLPPMVQAVILVLAPTVLTGLATYRAGPGEIVDKS